MAGVLPLFPLNSVLFPGLVMPLKVFEPRYRALVRHLMALPAGAPREFGVVAIRRGWEVAAGPAGQVAGPPPGPGAKLVAELTLHEVGCTAQVRQVTEHPDGRFDLVTVGRRRFRVLRVEPTGTPYLVAEVEYLPEPLGDSDQVDRLAPRVLAAFRRYLGLLRADPDQLAEQLPADPVVLSHLVAATANVTVDDRQQLLAQPDTAARLRAELALLKREEVLLRRVRAVPASLADLTVPVSPN